MTGPAPGRASRPAARILLVDAQARALLFRFDPGDRAAFWVTPGGAVDPGESYVEAARRELKEEVGLDLDPGPQVARRVVEFLTLAGVEVEADERYFRVDVDHHEVDPTGHTELERRVMTRWRWFTRAEIECHDEPIFPVDLLSMLDATEPHDA